MTTNPTAPQDGGEKLAAEWAVKLPRDQFEMLLLLTTKAHARGRHEALDEASEQVGRNFHLGSMAVVAAIRALQQKGPSNGK